MLKRGQQPYLNFCERLKKERETRRDKWVYRVTPCSAALSLSKSFLGQTTPKTERTGARTEREDQDRIDT